MLASVNRIPGSCPSSAVRVRPFRQPMPQAAHIAAAKPKALIQASVRSMRLPMRLRFRFVRRSVAVTRSWRNPIHFGAGVQAGFRGEAHFRPAQFGAKAVRLRAASGVDRNPHGSRSRTRRPYHPESSPTAR